jgi:integrase
MPKTKRKPAYLLHKATGQARVRIDGKDHYLGEYGSPESRDQYEELVNEWFARQGDVSSVRLTIDELALLYLKHAETYYVKSGEPTSETDCIRAALRLLIAFAGPIRCREFGPRQFREFRDSLVALPDKRFAEGTRTLSRQYINKVLRKVVRAFKWAAREELVPVTVWQALTTVEGLKRGRSPAREASRITVVDDTVVEKTLPELPPPVAAMVRLQRLTGMRPGEVCGLRPCDVSLGTDGIWTYRPERHKTEHHDRERIVFIGPQGQDVLRPYLERDPDAFCFSPKESAAWYLERKRANRKSKVQPSQLDRSKPEPLKTPGDYYDEGSYRKCVQAACDRAKVKPWAPNRLRHLAATVIRASAGIEGTRVILGHASAVTSEIYAEKDYTAARSIVAKIG